MAKYAKFFSVGGGAGPNGLQLPLGTILDTTLRQVQDGTGTGSPLYLSTTGLRVGTTAASAMYWDNVNNRLGIGTNVPVSTLQVNGTTRLVGPTNYEINYDLNGSLILNGTYANIQVRNSANLKGAYLGSSGPAGYLDLGQNGTSYVYLDGGSGTSTYSYFTNQLGVGTSSSLGAKFNIKGSGSTSATTSLLVQSSSGDQILSVLDDGTCSFGRSGGTTYCANFYSNQGLIARIGNNEFACPSAIYRQGGGLVTFYGTNNNSIAWNFDHNNSQLSSSTGISMVNIGGGYNTQVGAQFSSLSIQPTYNLNANTNTSSIARGIYYNPTITNLQVAQHRAIETVTGDVLFGTTSGSVAIGRTSIFNNSALNVEVPISGSAITDRINLYLSSSYTSAGLKLAASNGGSWIQSTQGGNGNTPYQLNLNPFGNSVTIGTTSNLGASLGIKGAGSTSATTSLLVQNSSGNVALNINDAQQVCVGSNNTFGYTFLVSGNAYITTSLRVDGNATFSSSLTVTGGTILTGGRTVVRDGNSLLVGGSPGNDTPDSSALTEIRTTTKGFLPPRMTTAQKNAIASPANGLMVFDTDLGRPCFYNGATWTTL